MGFRVMIRQTQDSIYPMGWRPFRGSVEKVISVLVKTLAPTGEPLGGPEHERITKSITFKLSVMPGFLSMAFFIATMVLDCSALLFSGRRLRDLSAERQRAFVRMIEKYQLPVAKTLILFYTRLILFDFYGGPDQNRLQDKLDANTPFVPPKGNILKCEILVVGSGPSGSVCAYQLASAGYDVLVTEEGDDQPPGRFSKYSSAEMNAKYRNAGLTPTIGGSVFTYAEGRCLGGGSEVNSGLFHFPMESVVEAWRQDHGLEDLDHGELMEHAGQLAELIRVNPLGDLEGPASLKLKTGGDALTWASRQIPRWITSRRNGDGTWTNTQHGMSTTLIPLAQERGARVMTRIRIERIDDAACIAHGIRMTDTGSSEPISIRFRRVFLCAGAIQSPFILRKSGFCLNIGNTLQMHPMVRVIAQFPEKTNEGDFGVPVRQVLEFVPDLTLGCSVSQLPHLALWIQGDERKKLRKLAPYLATYYALVSSPTRGKIRKLPFFQDPAVFYGPTDQDIKNLHAGIRKLGCLLFSAGAVRLFLPFEGDFTASCLEDLDDILYRFSDTAPEASTIHLFGSCPMGGVSWKYPVDQYGRLRKAANIYVTDASILPGCTGVNPQGMIMAVAQRNVMRFISQDVRA